MTPTDNSLEELAGRAGQGDAAAAAELRRRLKEGLGPLVRLALRGGGGHSPLSARIRQVARRAASPGAERVEADAVRDTLCTRILGRIRAGARSVGPELDTVTC